MPPAQAIVARALDVLLVAAATTSSPSSQTSAYMRVAAMTLAAYDWFITLKPEIRLYQRQSLSKGVVLFAAIRYVSIAAIVTSNVGFFGTGFTAAACHHYHLVAPLLKMFATLISQLIISIRTYAISRKSQWVLWTLTGLFCLSCVPEGLGNVWQRKAVQNSTVRLHHVLPHLRDSDAPVSPVKVSWDIFSFTLAFLRTFTDSCTSGNLPEHKIAWVHYLAAVVFDTVAMGIATFYLYSPTKTTITGLAKVMLEEGLLYFIFLTVANVVNLCMFLTADIATQSCAAVFGQAVTMIMSQRIILNLQEWTSEPSQGLSNSHSTPNYPLHVMQRSHVNPPTPNLSGTPTKHDPWLSDSPRTAQIDQKRSTPGGHARRASSGVFDFSDGGAGRGVHVVVEREVKYDENASVSEKSVSDVTVKK
ncbi:hypothetical protein FRC10_001793 [Ceratobasidium sp. 414]|nr:hypothetical protein FRC10_001793 [Ceratobasidium sp. 414]